MLNNQYVCSQSGRPGGAEKRKAISFLWWTVELCYGTVLTSLMNCVCPPPYVCYIGGGWYSPMYIGSYQCRWSVVLPMWTHCLGCRCRTDQSQVRQMVDSEYTTLGRILAPGSPQVGLASWRFSWSHFWSSNALFSLSRAVTLVVWSAIWWVLF